MTNHSKIDFDNRVIYGKSGKVYKIMPEMLSAGRTPEFEIRSILLAYKTDFETLAKVLSRAKHGLREGRTFGDVHDALTGIENFEKGLINFQTNGRSELVEFCALFCIGEGEDVGEFNEQIIIEKWNDWKEIPEADFFFLCAKAIKSFRQRFLEILEKTGQLPKQSQTALTTS